ncbi:ParM/StbA family protein [Paenibacillus aceris]|uniref:Plasmid segregation protein ParM n=1 Tax=Paenibacillus aceris TaxID=869555 RepID=A0ABS4I3Q3_9BACL|nr:ParM/StbA family protein [Paenibacillus aceris]MBP1965141.1 plasmid segregation protein ParM [Paenibacillus aceris]NHW33122.1 ParM/StbA family protein [Paenibacillus aceris]
MIKLAGIDIGNDSIKLVLDGSKEPLVIPNIIAPGYERHMLQEEDSPWKALDVMIYSPSLSQRNQRYFVGQLALEHEDNQELEDTDNKAISDQSLIVALTALAYQGLTNQAFNTGYGSVDEVEYTLGTGLPVRAFAKYNQQFEQRLLGEHEVTFLSTPQLHNRKIKVSIRKVAVSIEGAAAIFHLATHDSLQVKDEEIYNGCIGVCEIGALTTDFPVIKRMAIDNHFSHGEQIGIATYLDAVIRDVEDAYGYMFPSRAKLVQRIKNRNFTIQLLGEGQVDIRPIVDQHFRRAALRMIEMIKKRWRKYPDIQCFYVIGGGASALRPYIQEAAGSLKLRFAGESEFLNMYGYLKVAKSRLAQTAPV